MARQSEGPWYRASKDGWYLKVGGKQVSLKVKGEKNKAEAIDAWHRLMVGPKAKEAPRKPAEDPQEVKAGASVKEVVDAFLSDAKGRIKANTFRNYHDLLTAFSEAMGKHKAEALTSAKVLAYANRPKWGQAHRSNLLGIIKTAFRWANENGMIATNPIKAMKRPSMPSRGAKASVSPDTHLRLLEAATPQFRLFLTMLHETGCRPSELSRLTARDVDFKANVAILADHKTAHATGKPRIIILTPKAMDILKAQAEAYPYGTLLRNLKGNPWRNNNIGFAMRASCKRAGVKAITYGYRHAYATDALAQGVPDATVAALLGHSGTAMLHRHYSHLTSRIQVLREAAGKVR